MASKNKVVIFALNCVHTLKEMTSPEDVNKSMALFKDIALIFVLIVAGVSFVLFVNHEEALYYKVKWSVFCVALISAIWFVKNTIYVIKNTVSTLVSDQYKAILSQEVVCMDETCCMPGRVWHYKALLILSILAMVAFAILQWVIAYFNLYYLGYVGLLLVLSAYAGYIHTNKRLYEISKLLNKNALENNLTKEQSDSLLDTKEFFRKKFIFVSMSGFVMAFAILLFGALLELSLGHSAQFLVYGATTIAVSFSVLANQISLKAIQVNPF